ncbi:hypothetical protein [Paenibacillus glufosinatiresistens]|uniref:hypothetical protein n=1 Tax=Paenibacillus glufosinatiresistens TaxID=3070657 RepID=UPI00286DEAC6|nr:hypothetical protein [Paenibacillus sp. YX.27]
MIAEDLYNKIPIQTIMKKYASVSEISEYQIEEDDLQDHDRFLLEKIMPGGFVFEENGALLYLKAIKTKQLTYEEVKERVKQDANIEISSLIREEYIKTLEQKYPYTINSEYFQGKSNPEDKKDFSDDHQDH